MTEELLLLEARIWREEEAKMVASPMAYLNELRERSVKSRASVAKREIRN